jgi:hypothetical protein
MARKPVKPYRDGEIDYPELYTDLSAPFEAELIDWRCGSTNSDKTKSMALAYVDARTVMDRLDAACGFDGWQCNYTQGVNGSIVCNLGILVAGDWIWKADGAGATDVEGEKGALSDALKRAAVRFGVGRYLYDMRSPWVEIEPYGRSYKIKDSELKKLAELHDNFVETSGWGARAGIQAYRLLAKVMKEWVTDPASAQDFREKNAGEIALLPVAMQSNLFSRLDRIGASQQLATSEAAE